MAVFNRDLGVTGPLKQYGSGGSSQSSEYSATYDYSGLEDQIKRQDAVDALRGSKFAALYSGDIPAAIEAGNKVRNLVAGLRAKSPGATERNPHQVVMPNRLVRSESSSGSMRSEGPDYVFGDPEYMDSLSGDPVKKAKA